MSWADVRHHYEEWDDDPEPIPTPIAEKIAELLDADWAPDELTDKVRAMVAEWDAGDEHQRQLNEWEDERRAQDEAQAAAEQAHREAMDHFHDVT